MATSGQRRVSVEKREITSEACEGREQGLGNCESEDKNTTRQALLPRIWAAFLIFLSQNKAAKSICKTFFCTVFG